MVRLSRILILALELILFSSIICPVVPILQIQETVISRKLLTAITTPTVTTIKKPVSDVNVRLHIL